jgi:hypothetical protein
MNSELIAGPGGATYGLNSKNNAMCAFQIKLDFMPARGNLLRSALAGWSFSCCESDAKARLLDATPTQ